MSILLVCAAGMSTSLLVTRMEDAAKKRQIDVKIEAHPVGDIEKYGNQADVILLGPQVRYQLAAVKKQYVSKPVEVINMQDYGMMNGEKVLEHALKIAGK
ncbi:PTS sugar transporter subunit IIB [Allocoprobacillus halotolerans]|uniref:PTS sugar transporter subunit IIB n=1 Tax=Allocoprobacillus halotolerans TaxID=2944914 RepID=A0ABY5I2T4_9FIRM|nr:PTS sugar transporter subunit IIB [Allocoprobacillus halotolerans]UTY39636.1 PTS sugar transporter subunit IIB [Allocoprobacillus halotolerans]